ncbi:MAG: CPXCG motif-containing cysteine-rich protein [Nitrospirota bacterium]
MVLDLSVTHETYIEDCEVCCQPLEISYTIQDATLAHFDAKTLE